MVVPVARVSWVAYYTDWVRGRPTRGRGYTRMEPAVEVRFHPKKTMATIVRPDGTRFRKSADGFLMEGADGAEIPPPEFRKGAGA